MIVLLRLGSLTPFTVDEPDDCARLSVRVTLTGDDETDRRLLSELGCRSVGAGQYEIDLERLRGVALEAATSGDWSDRFVAMVAYADSKGWLVRSGTALLAHEDIPPN